MIEAMKMRSQRRISRSPATARAKPTHADAQEEQGDEASGPPHQQRLVDHLPQGEAEDDGRQRREYDRQRRLDEYEAHALGADVLRERVLGRLPFFAHPTSPTFILRQKSGTRGTQRGPTCDPRWNRLHSAACRACSP
jgi:hypothetical protein